MKNVSWKLRKAHKLLSLAVGTLFLFWTVSGLFFTLYPIEAIRGEHLKRAPVYQSVLVQADAMLSPAAVLKDMKGDVDSVTLRSFPTGPVYQVDGGDCPHLIDAMTGEKRSPIDEAMARMIAEAHWAGEGTLTAVAWVEAPPREAGSGMALWRADFAGKDSATMWIDPHAGTVKAVRTAKWRVFDVMWRFHILDVTGDDRIDSWWMKLGAFLGLVLVLCGFGLLIDRARKGRLGM